MGAITIQSLKPEALTWDTAIHLFNLRCRAQNISAGTCRNYAQTFRLFLRALAALGSPRPAELTIHHLRATMEGWKASGLASETLDNRFRNLRAFFNFLLKDGLIIVNPAAGLERPRIERRLIRPFTQEQFVATLAQIRVDKPLGLRDKALLLLLADTGLRISEALGLNICDLDLAGNTAIVMGKGRKERRAFWGETARRALLAWLKVRPDAKAGDPVFCNQFGGRLVAEVFSHRVKEYTRRAGIAANRLSCHALRHFWACQFLKNTGDIVTLSRLLGHTTLAMSKRYLNLTDDEVLAKARQVGSVLDRMGPLPGDHRRVRI
jgi:site-specific recombinase XerC